MFTDVDGQKWSTSEKATNAKRAKSCLHLLRVFSPERKLLLLGAEIEFVHSDIEKRIQALFYDHRQDVSIELLPTCPFCLYYALERWGAKKKNGESYKCTKAPNCHKDHKRSYTDYTRHELLNFSSVFNGEQEAIYKRTVNNL